MKLLVAAQLTARGAQIARPTAVLADVETIVRDALSTEVYAHEPGKTKRLLPVLKLLGMSISADGIRLRGLASTSEDRVAYQEWWCRVPPAEAK